LRDCKLRLPTRAISVDAKCAVVANACSFGASSSIADAFIQDQRHLAASLGSRRNPSFFQIHSRINMKKLLAIFALMLASGAVFAAEPCCYGEDCCDEVTMPCCE